MKLTVSPEPVSFHNKKCLSQFKNHRGRKLLTIFTTWQLECEVAKFEIVSLLGRFLSDEQEGERDGDELTANTINCIKKKRSKRLCDITISKGLGQELPFMRVILNYVSRRVCV